MRDYFASIEVTSPHDHDALPRMVGVVESPASVEPIGTAARIVAADHGPAEWCLRVEGVNLPGHWVMIGNWFVPDES